MISTVCDTIYADWIELTFADASISQSALEEALLSNMQHGRMSTLSRMSHAWKQ